MFKLRQKGLRVDSVEAFYCACSCAVTSCPCDCMSDAVLIVGSGNVLSNGYLATANCEIGVRV